MSQLAYLITCRGRGYSSLPLFVIIGGRGYAAPYRSGSEHTKQPRGTLAEVRMSHREVFYLEKSTYVHLFDVLIKVGIKGVFGGVFLGFLG